MLEELDKVDWANIEHVYSTAQTKIPTHIRNLLSPDSNVRETALHLIFGCNAQEWGTIWESAAYIVPFILELLDYEGTPDKVRLLKELAEWDSGFHPDVNSAEHKRDVDRYYQALRAGVETFLRLLENADKEVRLKAIEFLGYTDEQPQRILTVLRGRFDHETSSDVRASIVNCMSGLLSKTGSHYVDLREKYTPFFNQLLNPDLPFNIRSAAATSVLATSKTALWGGRFSDEDFTNAIAVCRDSLFLIPKDIEDDDELSLIIIRRRGILGFIAIAGFEALAGTLLRRTFYRKHFRTRHASSLLRIVYRILSGSVNDSRVTPMDAHCIVKAMLDLVFTMRSLSVPYPREHISRKADGKITVQYGLHHIGFHDGMTEKQKQTLEAVLYSDPFWQIPTNLLSFFYDLPDDREELRKLIAES